MNDEVFIEFENVEYSYRQLHYIGNAVDNISLQIKKGEFIVILGKNGSGKSTIAKLINAILLPSAGIVRIAGMETRCASNLQDIRCTVGMVFQNPDNQIVGSTVEQDIAFGPENLGICSCEIRDRVDYALEAVNMLEYRRQPISILSGGQKQKVAIAGSLAMKPQCIIFDESTSMLDPIGKKDVIQVINEINKGMGNTIIYITHDSEDIILADRIIVIQSGTVAFDGSPRAFISNIPKIKEFGINPPQTVELLYDLFCRGYLRSYQLLYNDEIVCYLKSFKKSIS